MLTCDPMRQTLDVLKVIISLLLFSLCIFSSSLISPSSSHYSGNSCFPDPLDDGSHLLQVLWSRHAVLPVERCFQVFCKQDFTL